MRAVIHVENERRVVVSNASNNFLVGRRNPLAILRGREQPRPCIEELHRLSTRLDLGINITDGHLGQGRQQFP